MQVEELKKKLEEREKYIKELEKKMEEMKKENEQMKKAQIENQAQSLTKSIGSNSASPNRGGGIQQTTVRSVIIYKFYSIENQRI